MRTRYSFLKWLKVLPHLVFIPMWIYFFIKMTEFYNLSPEEIGVGFSNNILFVFTLGYVANAIYFTSLYQILKANGHPRWALALHILFPLFLIGFQLFAHGAAGGLDGYWL